MGLQIGQRVWAIYGDKFYESQQFDHILVIHVDITNIYDNHGKVVVAYGRDWRIYKKEEVFTSMEDAYAFAIKRQKELIESAKLMLDFQIGWLQQLRDRDV